MPPQMVLYVAAPIFVLVIVVGSIILVARGLRGQALDLCLAVLLAGSLVVTFAGVAQVIAPLLSIPLGRSFTYFIPGPSRFLPPVAPGVIQPTPEEEREQARARADNDFRNDLVYGATTTIAGLILLAVLAPARRVLRPRSAESDPVRSTFFVLMMLTATLAALSSIIVAVSQLIRRYIVVPVGPDQTLPQPGGAIAVALVFTPLWIWFTYRVLLESRRSTP
jgi:hypothetical protein